ncbi:MAG: sulfite exporter TauE/SafE family protein [Opitutales bacterium]
MKRVFSTAFIVVVTVWAVAMTAMNAWDLFVDWWAMSITMMLGSFVAGSTPAGGGAVAFPVFTKLLNVPADEARTFGLMIQSIGMTMASLFIFSKGIPVYTKVILRAVPGGILGMTIGALFIDLPFPYPRVLFTCMLTAFGIAFYISHKFLNHQPCLKTHRWGSSSNLHFFLTGIFGGILSSFCGSGIDMIAFIVMTLAYGMHEKKAIPTSVVTMTAISLYGFFWHGAIEQNITIEWSYWAVCVPIVAIGAPLGAYVASRVSRDWILVVLSLLITIDLLSTLLLIELTPQRAGIMCVLMICSALSFYGMLRWRHKYAPAKTEESGEVPAAPVELEKI